MVIRNQILFIMNRLKGLLVDKNSYKVVEILPETLKTCLFAIVFWICNLRKKKTHLDRSFDCF